MHVKSFFAATVEAALAEGSRELGPEALLVESRKAPPEARHLGAVEVVLAVTSRAPGSGSGTPAAGTTPFARELAELGRQMDAMRRSIAHSAVTRPAWLAPSSHTAAIYSALVEREVDATVAGEIAEAVAAQLGAGRVDARRAFEAAAGALASRLLGDATLGREGEGVV